MLRACEELGQQSHASAQRARPTVVRKQIRQFIPEHYFFFDPKTIARLLSAHRLETREVRSIGKNASLNLVMNRLSRFLPWMPPTNGISRLTFRMNPLDIMLVFAMKHE